MFGFVHRAAEVVAAWEQTARRVYLAGVGPCGFLNDAMGPNKNSNAETNNNYKLYYEEDTDW